MDGVVSESWGQCNRFSPVRFYFACDASEYETILGFALSLTVETIQLVCKVGCFDVDDLLLNTIGSALGYVLFLICDKFRRIRYEKV